MQVISCTAALVRSCCTWRNHGQNDPACLVSSALSTGSEQALQLRSLGGQELLQLLQLPLLLENRQLSSYCDIATCYMIHHSYPVSSALSASCEVALQLCSLCGQRILPLPHHAVHLK